MTAMNLPEVPLQRAHLALIRYPRFKELHQMIQQCQQMSALGGEPQCMSLEGVTGAGKSTLMWDYAQAFPKKYTAAGVSMPVFYMLMPSPATVKGVAAAMLEQLGDPAAHKGPQWSMDSRLIKLIPECGITLVILDDFHHLIDRNTDRILETVSDWLKVLIKKTNVPFVVVGIEGKVERILRSNAQLSRLFAARETLEPFDWATQRRDFAKFVEYMETAIRMPLTPGWPRDELIRRLHYATDGVVGNVMNLLRYAALVAQQEKREVIELATLSCAFQSRLSKHLRQKVNPFDTPLDQVFAAPAPAAADRPNPPEGRRGGRKPRAASISETLRAR
jgi:hypothetical protein